jgi:DNA (cytosine-5)-methyltransferase 1
VNWSEVPNVDIIAGGYPCQPFSQAGKRKGKEDPRHLWPYVLDAIRAIRPRYALMENVRGHLTLGFGDVLADLASCGYSAEWQIIPASSVGAPHRRDRIFFVAYPDGERPHRTEIDADETGKPSLSNTPGRGETMAHSDDARSRTSECPLDGELSPSLVFGDNSFDGISGRGSVLAYSTSRRLEKREPETESSEDSRLGSNEVRAWWETEPDVGRVAHGIPSRVDRLRGLGNAVVPQVAEFVGRLIAEHADN